MELLLMLYMFFAPIGYMLCVFVKVFVCAVAITTLLIIIALIKVEREEHILKVLYYKLLSKLFPKRWKVGWCVDMPYGVDHCCDVTYAYDYKKQKKIILKTKLWQSGMKDEHKRKQRRTGGH